MSTRLQLESSRTSLKLDVIFASLLLNAGTLLALVTWITADRLDRWSWVSNEQLRTVVSIVAVGVPVTIVAILARRLSERLSVDLGTGTLLALITPLSALFTTAAVLHSALPWNTEDENRLLHLLINCGTIFFLARIFARRARRSPDWISITGTIFAVGLLPLGLASLVVETFVAWATASLTSGPLGEVPLIIVAFVALYLAVLLPSLFLGRALLKVESARYRPNERRFTEVFAAFGVGSLAATVVPLATTRLYDALQTCTEPNAYDYVCTRPPGEWVVIGLLTGLTAWRLIRGAERAKEPLLWIGALPPVITTAIAINWYLPEELGGLPIAGALIALGGLLLLRRATMTPAPRSRRAAKRR